MTVWELRRADGKIIRCQETTDVRPPMIRWENDRPPAGTLTWYRDGRQHGEAFRFWGGKPWR